VSSEYEAARQYQNAGRAYDDPHPAELVSDPLHKWKFYTREVWLSCRRFNHLLAEGSQALSSVQALRLTLDDNPDMASQRLVYKAFERVDQYFEHGVIMLGLSAGEALGEAIDGLQKVTDILPLPESTKFDPQSKRIYRNQARVSRLQQGEEQVEQAIATFRAAVAAESGLIQAALPDYNKIAPQLVVISSFDW